MALSGSVATDQSAARKNPFLLTQQVQTTVLSFGDLHSSDFWSAPVQDVLLHLVDGLIGGERRLRLWLLCLTALHSNLCLRSFNSKSRARLQDVSQHLLMFLLMGFLHLFEPDNSCWNGLRIVLIEIKTNRSTQNLKHLQPQTNNSWVIAPPKLLHWRHWSGWILKSEPLLTRTWSSRLSGESMNL